MRRFTVVTTLVLSLVCALPAWAQIDSAKLGGLRARSIGPAGMSGRVAAVDVVIDNPDIIYVGAATGGVWKSEDGGTTWTPIFDDQPVAAIGAVTIDQTNPAVVWVGTGEGNPRNSISVGNGIYKSIDGGRTWSHLGLEKTERIHRIILDPRDTDTAYVATLGQTWGENEERGVYKTTDGGITWEQILYVNERTGAADLAMDPTNPNKLFAAMWEYRRWPFSFKSGGEGSGVYMSYDGGATWTHLTADDGLPEGELGRIGIAIAPSQPQTIYALVEATKSALVRSDDGGHTWRTVNDTPGVSPRPFYYSDLRVDPERPERVYRVASSVSLSVDGGRSFGPLNRGFVVHPDHHAFWIHPDDGSFIINGNDGGVAISRNRGATWNFIRNLPLAQYYHIAVDMDVPYNVYGGLQDNGSWRGPSAIWSGGFFGGGIRNFHWTMVAFGDGFDTRASLDSGGTRGYAMSQGGFLVRWDLAKGEQRNVRPDGPDDDELRFNWSAGLAQDPFDPQTIYYGSQYLHKSSDEGETWSMISPDLTTDEVEWQQQAESGGLTLDVTAAENYTTIIAVAPSALQRDLLWVGTDDGRLHVTQDGGANWTSLEGNIPDVPANTWIPHIEPSRHDPAAAFVVFDDHRRSNWTPYVFHTDDYGATWTNLGTDDLWGYALTIVQDYENPNLLFLGTEFGLWVSFDKGSSWNKWTHGVPTVSVMDMVIHPRDHDLVLGTHGRAVYILDDIRPLREVAEGSLDSDLHLYSIPDAQQYGSFAAQGELIPGSAEFVGQNRPYGALITFSVNDADLADADPNAPPATGGFNPFAGPPGAPRGPQAKFEFADSEGTVVRTMQVPVHAGLNRAVWNLRRDPFRRAPGSGGGFFGGGGGPEVPPGDYAVTVSYGEFSAEGQITVLSDPRTSYTAADRSTKWDAILEMGAVQESGADAVQRLLDVRTGVNAVLAKAGPAGRGGGPGSAPDTEPEEGAAEESDPKTDVVEAGNAIIERLVEIENLFRVPPGTAGIVKDDSAMSKVQGAMGRLQSSWGPPSSADAAYSRQAREALDAAIVELNAVITEDVAAFRQLVLDAELELFPAMEPVGDDEME